MFALITSSTLAFHIPLSRIFHGYHHEIIQHKSYSSLNAIIAHRSIGNFALSSSKDDDISISDLEDLKYLEQEFKALSAKSKTLSYESFMDWEEIQALISDGLCSKKEIKDLWVTTVKSTDKTMDFENFVKINRVLDDMFEYEDEREDEANLTIGNGDVEKGELMGYDDFDVWSPSFNPSDALEPEFIAHLKLFYDAHASKTPPFGMSYNVFASWDEVKQMLSEGEIDEGCLEELWAETLMESAKNFPEKMKQTKKNIDFDIFLRLNIRLDQILDELQEALESLSDEQVEEYYRKEFAELTTKSGGNLLSYNELMGWSDMQEMIRSGMIAQHEVDKMWDALPKQPLGTFYKKKGFGTTSSVEQSDGITVEAFLALNNAIEDEERSEIMGEDSDSVLQ